MRLDPRLIDLPHYDLTGVTGGDKHLSAEEYAKLRYLVENKENIENLLPAGIYGVTWDGGPDPKWTRIGRAKNFVDPVPCVAGMTAAQCSSPFDNIYPWSEMTIEERAGGTMVKIPKFYYQLYNNTEGDDSSGLTIKISQEKLDGFYTSPAHVARFDGDSERDVVYVGRYHCASDFKSKTGVAPKVSMTHANFQTNIHKLGENIWMWDFATLLTIQLLYLVEFANWNSQGTIGISNTRASMGASNSMPYHTGTMASARTTGKVGVQYRNIEDLWGNVIDHLGGGYYNSNGMNIILNPNNFNDTENGIFVGLTSSGFPSKFIVTDTAGFPMFSPTEFDGNSGTTFSCDYWNCAPTQSFFSVGGNSTQPNVGLFFMSQQYLSTASNVVGSRLMELPDPE